MIKAILLILGGIVLGAGGVIGFIIWTAWRQFKDYGTGVSD